MLTKPAPAFRGAVRGGVMVQHNGLDMKLNPLLPAFCTALLAIVPAVAVADSFTVKVDGLNRGQFDKVRISRKLDTRFA
jgi:hypothetical protein